jgi:hypothetical protein
MTTGAQRPGTSGPFSSQAVVVEAFNCPSVVANTAVDVALTVPGAEVGDNIIVTPLGTWLAGLVLGPHRCLVAGTVQMRVGNCTVADLDPASQDYQVLLSHVRQ